jgi:hypothetical protein
MLGRFWRCGRASALAAAVVAGTAAAALSAGVIAAVPARASSAAPRSAAARAAVPWASVGAGWVLVQYSTGTAAKPAPATLYLVSPSGGKYPVYQWPASKAAAPSLLAWSGDKTRALVQLGRLNELEQVNLRTGQTARISLPASVTPADYTRPSGLQLLGVAVGSSASTLGRYTLAGQLVRVLGRQANWVSAIYTPDGTALAVSASTGLQLVSNAGGVIRKLAVPAADPRIGCQPVRWWSPGTVLAECTPKGGSGGQLWLVPAGGATPRALTPVRKSGPDLGDLDAWALPSGLYLQSAGPCGTLELNRQAANGSVSAVRVPGFPGGAGASVAVVTALGSRLLLHGLGCTLGGQLTWLNPASGAETWLFKSGAEVAVPYYSSEDGTFR